MRPWHQLSYTEQLSIALWVMSIVAFLCDALVPSIIGFIFGLVLFVYE